MTADSRSQLQAALAGGDTARGALLESYRAWLELLARVEIGRRLQTKVDVADVVQETFLEAHRSLDRFRGTTPTEFSAWLRGILAIRISLLLRHYFKTQGRDIRREREIEVDLDQSSRAIDGGLIAFQSTPSEQAVKHEQGTLLADALARLPDDYREVIILRHLEELTFPEVAARMDRTLDSVQKLWVRALARLRQLMPSG
jgi:RNA polymerase sigma-70 factor (ECF subfamily)